MKKVLYLLSVMLNVVTLFLFYTYKNENEKFARENRRLRMELLNKELQEADREFEEAGL